MKSNRQTCWQAGALVTMIAIVLSCNEQAASARQLQPDQAQQNSIESSYLAGASEYPVAPWISALVNSEGFAPGLSSASGYLNSKRARKMSAFVPMRGRRESANEQLPALLSNAGGDQDSEIGSLRLVAASQPGGPEARWFATVPRQFANQMAARHSEQLIRAEDTPAATSSIFYGSPMMQAKLRRAFHPMRGKRLPLAIGAVDTVSDDQQSDI